MKKYMIYCLSFFIFLGMSSSLDAKTDFDKNQVYYQSLCESKNGYNSNKTTCVEFEKYLGKKADKSEQIEKSLKQAMEDTKNDITKLSEVVKQSNLLIKDKQNLIKNTKAEIKQTNKEIIELEDELIDRLEIAQELNNENFIIDFIMAADNLEDFLIKFEGINAMNAANADLVSDLDFKQKKLVKKEDLLKEETKKLKESKKLNKEVLKEYYQKEAELFEKLESEIKQQASYNSNLDSLNYEDFESLNNNANENNKQEEKKKEEVKEEVKDKEETKDKEDSKDKEEAKDKEEDKQPEKKPEKKPVTNSKLRRPINHGYISATAWYYPASFGGGWHPGMDIAASKGTPIYAPGKGVELMRTSTTTGYGKYSVTAHQLGKDTYTYIFGHMSNFGSATNTIKANQVIGYVGSTGYSTGPHLHVEIIKHKNKSLSSVVKTFRNNRDIFFGLGYNSIGNCSNVCRLAPQSYYGLSYGQSF